MTDVLKIFNNVASGVKSVNTIAKVFHDIDSSNKEQSKKVLKPRTIMDVSILQTILEKVAKSENPELIADFQKHQITERLETIAILIIQYFPRDGKNLNKTEKQRLKFVTEEVECIYDHAKALMLANVMSAGMGSMRL